MSRKKHEDVDVNVNDVSVDSIPNDVFEQIDTSIDPTPNDVSEQIDASVDSTPNDVSEQIDTSVDSTTDDASEQIDTSVDPIPNDVFEQIDALKSDIKKINSDTVEKKKPITRSIFNRDPFVEKIYIEGTTLIKEREYKDWRKEFFYKELFDYNIVSAIRFWRSLANDIHSYEEALDRLYNKPKRF